MERQTIAKSTLIQILLDETTKALTGESYLLLAKQVRIRRRDGEPNWDADCYITKTRAKKAFRIAKHNAQQIFNIPSRDLPLPKHDPPESRFPVKAQKMAPTCDGRGQRC